ncbi:LOW QUALITY PROTEIN: E3 ubiquitin-protein ligase TRIM41-like [Melozone crissalis]|uniref:LOW QUALITY PROTEIN: E3 ubiquitin-protein ligase TRIM41-like n=1 Tax=Melozone crissalis TaxID=40204 RepID=UPI0023DA2A32|nr:LOW QUALITY PROTEIN: E3 ubiquitin-protein ligase TRIM41-like [Melozone crissalis]
MAAPLALGGPGSLRPDPVETLQEEAICAICLDYFADPVSIGCGHNFCRGCISRLWARGGGGGTEPGPERSELEEEEEEEEEEELEEDELDVEHEEEEEEDGVEEEEEEEDMWEEEEEEEDEEEEGELWGDPAEDEEEEDEDEGGAAWAEGAEGGGLYLGYDEDAMEEDVEEEEEAEDEEEEEEEDEDEDAEEGPAAFTCPQCRKSFSQRSFRPNLQLANMVHIIRQLHPGPGATGTATGAAGAAPEPGPAPGGPPELCPKHREPLKLFCEQDLAPICVVCREARGHKQHSVLPLDEALQECKTKLQSHLEPLRRQLDAVLKQKSSEEEKISLLREQMQAEMQELEADFEELQQFLAGEQLLLLRQLQERHQALQARQQRNLGALEERGAALQRLISEAEAAGRQDGLQLLKDIKGTFIRCENIKFQEPEMIPVDVGRKFRNCFLQDVVMRKMEKVFSKVPQADVTLDPSTAHPRLSLSPDRRSVRLSERRAEPAVPPRPGPGAAGGDLCVLGSPGFTAGRHYWEVEVGGRRGWAVGAARESARARPQGAHGPAPPPPRREIWALGTSGKKYQALTATEQTALAPAEQPRRFGVYLDYERGQLCFYNAESMSHIHTFHICCCRQRVFPFFRVLARGTRIKICT